MPRTSSKSSSHASGYAKQKDLLELSDKVDTLAIHVLKLDEKQSLFGQRLDRIEIIVEKTYKLLDSHVKTQIRFDHELAATRNIVDGHEKRISTLESKG